MTDTEKTVSRYALKLQDAIVRIQDALDGQDWNADTCGEIAEALRDAGYPVRDVTETDDNAPACETCNDGAVISDTCDDCGQRHCQECDECQ